MLGLTPSTTVFYAKMALQRMSFVSASPLLGSGRPAAPCLFQRVQRAPVRAAAGAAPSAKEGLVRLVDEKNVSRRLYLSPVPCLCTLHAAEVTMVRMQDGSATPVSATP